jgi:carbon storage regulator CsrA
MLVVSRCLNSAVRIGDNIRVKVLRVGRRRVSLGIEAPTEVPVIREEAHTAGGDGEDMSRTGLDIRVLVVEDTPTHALLIERVLTRRGVRHVVRTSSGEDAIRLLAMAEKDPALRPDLVLLDLQLPGMSGMQVLNTMKSAMTLRLIPVVVLSCHDSEREVVRCLEAGANAFVSKAENYEHFQKSILRITDFWSNIRKVG